MSVQITVTISAHNGQLRITHGIPEEGAEMWGYHLDHVSCDDCHEMLETLYHWVCREYLALAKRETEQAESWAERKKGGGT